ncbi:MAG TPA: flagellar biosynthesis protein FlhF, partial [Albitalea sp.]|nr:flagellar biosynthesis protein FlhF [Albitalea sp.]
MNVKRFTARTAREALTQLRQSLGDDAVVLSTKPCAEGVEILAMAPEGMEQIERMTSTPKAAALPAPKKTTRTPLHKPSAAADVDADVEQLAMSTLSFQDYVRERMLKRRQEAMKAEAAASAPAVEPQPEPEPTPLQSRLAARMNAPAAPVKPPVLREEIRAAAPEAPMPSLADT